MPIGGAVPEQRLVDEIHCRCRPSTARKRGGNGITSRSPLDRFDDQRGHRGTNKRPRHSVQTGCYVGGVSSVWTKLPAADVAAVSHQVRLPCSPAVGSDQSAKVRIGMLLRTAGAAPPTTRNPSASGCARSLASSCRTRPLYADSHADEDDDVVCRPPVLPTPCLLAAPELFRRW